MLRWIVLAALVGCGTQETRPADGAHFVDVGGHRIHYENRGSGERAIVFVHGRANAALAAFAKPLLDG